ncbi:hypothetical protein EJB05_44465, partial [Eragrostis curvula]
MPITSESLQGALSREHNKPCNHIWDSLQIEDETKWIWNIWRQRSNKIFENKTPSLRTWKKGFKDDCRLQAVKDIDVVSEFTEEK